MSFAWLWLFVRVHGLQVVVSAEASVCWCSQRRAIDMPAMRAGEISWSAYELSVLAHAERVRQAGRIAIAERMLVLWLPLPSSLPNYLPATSADVPLVQRWYAAFTGRVWDGRAPSLRRARNNVTNRRRYAVRNGGSVSLGTYYAARTCHVLVESSAVAIVGRWPDRVDVGHLDIDDPNALSCAYCDALLLKAEADPIDCAIGVVRGKHCCAKGCV